MASSAAAQRRLRRRAEVVVIMGAIGCSKSRLFIDLASLFPSEVINFDKMQVYRGLDITTKKITPAEPLGVPHHLLVSYGPDNGEMTPSQFHSLGHAAIFTIASRGNLPLLVRVGAEEAGRDGGVRVGAQVACMTFTICRRGTRSSPIHSSAELRRLGRSCGFIRRS